MTIQDLKMDHIRETGIDYENQTDLEKIKWLEEKVLELENEKSELTELFIPNE